MITTSVGYSGLSMDSHRFTFAGCSRPVDVLGLMDMIYDGPMGELSPVIVAGFHEGVVKKKSMSSALGLSGCLRRRAWECTTSIHASLLTVVSSPSSSLAIVHVFPFALWGSLQRTSSMPFGPTACCGAASGLRGLLVARLCFPRIPHRLAHPKTRQGV